MSGGEKCVCVDVGQRFNAQHLVNMTWRGLMHSRTRHLMPGDEFMVNHVLFRFTVDLSWG